MKKYILLFCISSLVIASCKKEGDDAMYEPANLLRNGNFEDMSLLDEVWTAEGGGYSVFNTVDVFEGKNSLNLGAETCRDMFYDEMLPVEAHKMYELSFAIKMPGVATGCAGEFVVSIYQGEKEILYFNLSSETAADWNLQKYYITPESDEPLSLELIVGMDDLLLDDMQLKEVVEL